MSTPENDSDEALAEERVSAEAVTEEDVAADDVAVEDDAAIEQAEDGAVEEQAPEVAEEEVDPVAEFKAAMRRAPGDWYVIHSYAGYENKVKTNLETVSRTWTSATTSSRWKFPPKRSPRSRTASASRSIARFCRATSWSA